MSSENEVSVADFFVTEPVPQEVYEDIKKQLQSGQLFRYINDDSEVSQLEKDFAFYMGKRFALAVNSCSSAIFLSLKSVGVGAGDQVLTPAFTFGAVPSSIVHAGAIPVLVEVKENYRLDLEDFRNKLHKGIKAVVLSYMRGHTSDIDAVLELCREYDIPLIEDAAHSMGATWDGKKVGSFGITGCFSFQSYKLINGGEGGILVTDDEDVMARAIIMSGAYERNWQKHGTTSTYLEKYVDLVPLYNMRLSNLSALVIRSQLPHIDERVTVGRQKVSYIKNLLENNPHISIPTEETKEKQAPDSLQFNLKDFSDDESKLFMELVRSRGVSLYVFGLHEGNARVFWNWKFIGNIPDLPQTRGVLMRACDIRIPSSFPDAKLKVIADIIKDCVREIKSK